MNEFRRPAIVNNLLDGMEDVGRILLNAIKTRYYKLGIYSGCSHKRNGSRVMIACEWYRGSLLPYCATHSQYHYLQSMIPVCKNVHSLPQVLIPPIPYPKYTP